MIVDDHHLVRLALHTLLDAEDDLEIIGEAASLAAARSLLERVAPDVLVLDVHLPDGDGLELCQAATDKGVKTLVLTAYDGEELLIEAMRAGASGYVLKQDPPESVLTALRTVGAGGAQFSTAATPQMLAMIASGGMPEDPLAHLTDRERSLLELLGEGLSNRQIAERLFLGERTVKNYVSRLLRKLGLDRICDEDLPRVTVCGVDSAPSALELSAVGLSQQCGLVHGQAMSAADLRKWVVNRAVG